MVTSESLGKPNRMLGVPLWTSFSLSGVGEVETLLHIVSLFPGARFSKVPKTLQARKAILCARCLH